MTTTPTLTSDEQDEAYALLSELLKNGYVAKEFHSELRAGARVRHTGHRWPEAYTAGTGVVLHVTHKPHSAWSQQWCMPDVEIVVRWDEQRHSVARLSTVAQYHVQHVSGGNQ